MLSLIWNILITCKVIMNVSMIPSDEVHFFLVISSISSRGVLEMLVWMESYKTKDLQEINSGGWWWLVLPLEYHKLLPSSMSSYSSCFRMPVSIVVLTRMSLHMVIFNMHHDLWRRLNSTFNVLESLFYWFHVEDILSWR